MESSYVKRSSYKKDVTTVIKRTVDLDLGDGICIPIYLLVRFMQRGQFNQQHQNKVTFYRPSVVYAQLLFENEKTQMQEQNVIMLLIHIHKDIEKLFPI